MSKKTASRVLRYFLTFLMAVSLCIPATGIAAASNGEKGTFAPTNPLFTEWMQAPESDRSQEMQSGIGHALGHLAGPLDRSLPAMVPQITDEQEIARAGKSSLPASYDLRNTGRVTGVRDQGTAGSCWAHAALGSIESMLLPEETKDYSENNMKNRLTDFDRAAYSGGDSVLAMAYLSRWEGPVLESQDPYDASSSYSSSYQPDKHIQQLMFIPPRTNSLDNDKIKQALMDYGALDFSMTWDDASYNEATCAHYYTGSYSLNHDVTLVGWDDSYSRNNFLVPPPGDGAFIIKNSWGASWGKEGYFYISYYDTMAGIDQAVFNGVNGTSDYDQVYMYDPFGWLNNYGFGSDTAWFANVFKADADITLKAASFYVNRIQYTDSTYTQPTGPSSYDIYVYRNPADASDPESGTLVTTKSVTMEYSGYYTVDLTEPVFIPEGEKYSIVIKGTTPGFNYPIPIEYAMPDYTTAATAEAGQSYISPDGNTWADATTADKTANVCIKAFADYGGSGANIAVTGISLNTDVLSLATDKTVPLTATLTPANATDRRVVWSSSNPKIAVVDNEGYVTGVAAGSAVITVAAMDGGFLAECQVTVTEATEPEGPELIVYIKKTGEEIKSGDFLHLATGKKYQLLCTAYDENGDIVNEPDMIFSSYPKGILKMSKKGLMTTGNKMGVGIGMVAEKTTGEIIIFAVDAAKPCSSQRILGDWSTTMTNTDGKEMDIVFTLNKKGRIDAYYNGSMHENAGIFSLSGNKVKMILIHNVDTEDTDFSPYYEGEGKLSNNKMEITYFDDRDNTGVWEMVRE